MILCSSTHAGLSRAISAATVLLGGLLGSVTAVHGQTLTANFRLPDSSGYTGPLRVETTSGYTVDLGVYTVTDTVGFVDSYGGDTSAAGSFAWLSIQQDGSYFPKIWTDVFSYSHTGTYPEFYDATSTWQTLGSLQVSPSVIFVNAEWYSDRFWEERVDGTPGFVTANGATWAMGPQTPVGLRDSSLSASIGNAQDRLLLDSEVIPVSGQYRYTYTLTNTLDEALSISWDPASLEITLSPGEVYTHSFISDYDGTQANGYATVDGETFADVEMIANAIVPIPEPTSLSLMLTAIALALARRRHECAP